MASSHSHGHLHKKIDHSISLNERATDTYASVFGGDGSTTDGWPSISQWISTFDELFESNKEAMSSSCAQWDVADNSDDEIANIKSSITSVAESSGLDARFILAIVMQESNGCVRVHTTDNGVVNPGLMQSHNGEGSCNNDDGVQNPCPESEILQMIKDGAEGTTEGDGLKQCYASVTGTDAEAYYQAARCYNSGSIASDGNLGQGGSTHCYSSDVANRLIGWTSGTSSCDANTVGDLYTSNWSGSSDSSSDSTTTASTSASATSTTSWAAVTIEPVTAAAATTTTAAAAAAIISASVAVQAAEAEVTSTASVVSTPVATSTASVVATSVVATPTAAATSVDEKYPYAISSCQEYYSVVAGDYCRKIEVQYGITAASFQSWNTGLDASCTNLWLGYQYCVKA
ncbi:hypothetical protein N7495_000565 [Penicillium taxi]|uniref:uncharacterized protein n=1 Tax=Penicillium taxi TaxID=168475 RepID=UPI0025457B38|nr:uncharacterized protein N7495_000565 [Penicillium taxi]KAJ5907883.1 hypothetical protein N7495_000565 [Penicillium taxi]